MGRCSSLSQTKTERKRDSERPICERMQKKRSNAGGPVMGRKGFRGFFSRYQKPENTRQTRKGGGGGRLGGKEKVKPTPTVSEWGKGSKGKKAQERSGRRGE